MISVEILFWTLVIVSFLLMCELTPQQKYGGRKVVEKKPSEFTPSGVVPIPKSADEAALMTLLGESWLKQHAPERLRPGDDTRYLLKWSCRLYTDFIINRYLMANAHGRMSGAEKAQRHIELCSFYVAIFRGYDDPSLAMRECREDYVKVHSATQALTDHLDEVIGFPLNTHPNYDILVPKFFQHFHKLATEALSPGFNS